MHLTGRVTFEMVAVSPVMNQIRCVFYNIVSKIYVEAIVCILSMQLKVSMLTADCHWLC